MYTDPVETESFHQALIDAEVTAVRRMPDEVLNNLLQLSSFDTIVLANAPGHLVPEPTQEAMRRFVHDTGGGLNQPIALLRRLRMFISDEVDNQP